MAAQQQQQQSLQQAATLTNFAATNAFAQQQAALPPGYAYFYGQIPNQVLMKHHSWPIYIALST